MLIAALGYIRVCSDFMDYLLFAPIPLLFAIAAFFTLLALDIRRRRLALAGILRLPVLAIFDLLPPALTAGFVAALIATRYPEASAQGVLPLRSPSTLGMVLCFGQKGANRFSFRGLLGCYLPNGWFLQGPHASYSL